MAPSGLSDAEVAFIGQSDLFLRAARARYPDAPQTLADAFAKPTAPLTPVVVDDLSSLSDDEVDRISTEHGTGYGVTHVVPRIFVREDGTAHPLRELADRVGPELRLGYPVDHPMEGHAEAIARFGPPDGTLKLYNLPIPPGQERYKEQAETNEPFAAHNDGLGYAGLIKSSILVLDRPPMSGGYTYFQNLVRLAPALANDDPEAFSALFLPDAITALRPRGKGAIEVKAPVFFLGRDASPQVFFRISSGEYEIGWRAYGPLARARDVLHRFCGPFGPDTRFVHFMRSGDSVIIDNRQVVHGRTSFIDPPEQGRVLARKWFVPRAEDATYRHVPGIEVNEDYARLFPLQFTGPAIEGEWHFDSSQGRNVPTTTGHDQ